MSLVNGVLDWFVALPAAIMVLVGIFLIGVIFARIKITEAFKSAIYVAVGIIGVNALLGVFADAVIPSLMQVIESTGMHLDVVDLGTGSAEASVTFPLKFYGILLVVGFLVNLIMLLIKQTNTLDVDIFNYYVFALSSAFVYAISHSVLLAIIAFVITEVITLKFADMTAPAIAESYGLEGVSVPHGNAVIYAPIGILVNTIVEKIPFLAKIDWSPEEIENKFGNFVQPSVLGFFMGIILGIVAKEPFGNCMMMGASIATMIVIYPKVINVLIEGITPIGEGMKAFAEKKLHRKFYIGLDAAILIGMPDVMSVGILLVPIILILAFILPGNRVLPLADLAIAAPFLVSCCMPYCKKNIFRGLLCGIIIFIISLYACTDTAVLYTKAAEINGLPFESLSTSLGICSSYVSWIIARVTQLFF